MRTRLEKPGWHRNLLRRPTRPALGRGRLQILCRRALLTHGGAITTSVAIEWCYSQLLWEPRRKNAFNVAARRPDQPRRLCYVHRGFSARCPVIADRILSMTPRPRPCPAVSAGLRNQLAKTDCLAISSARRRMQRWRLGARPKRNAAKLEVTTYQGVRSSCTVDRDSVHTQ
jgi:hypothetical protein